MADPKTESLIERMLAGNRLALARLITQVENRTDAVPAVMRAVDPRAAREEALALLGLRARPGAQP